MWPQQLALSEHRKSQLPFPHGDQTATNAPKLKASYLWASLQPVSFVVVILWFEHHQNLKFVISLADFGLEHV